MNLKHIENIIRSFAIEPKPLDKIVGDYYRRHKEIGSKQRRFISNAVFGIMRWRRRLEGILQKANITKPSNLQIIAAYLLWTKLHSEVELQKLPTFIGKPLDFDITEDKFPNGKAAYWSYPNFIFDKFVNWKGDKWASKTAAALNEEADVIVRANTIKITRDELKNKLEDEGVNSKPTLFSPWGLLLESRLNLPGLDSFKKGFFEIQEEASQLVGFLVNPKTDELILDVCAGAGGKTLLLAMLMQNKGRIIASDVNETKLNNLKKRAKLACVANLQVLSPEKLIHKYKNQVDALLIDAPCSGTGTLRRNPDLKWRISEEDLKTHVDKQKDLLKTYAPLVKKQSRLIYVTCSILPDENEDVINWFRQSYPWKVININDLLKIPYKEKFITKEGYFRTDPATGSMDGFFGCVLERI